MVDPFGRAIRDHYLEDMESPLIQRDGPTAVEHPIQSLYFESVDLDSPGGRWLASFCDGPLLDLGAGAGRHAVAFQKRFETVALEVSDHLATTMEDRGVEDARVGDMFALQSAFPTNRFESVIALGTQSNLVRSRAGLERFLLDVADITNASGTLVLDSYDPTTAGVEDLLGYRSDDTPGMAFRVMHFEYEEEIGPTLLFRLFSPEVLREVAADTPWSVEDTSRPTGDPFYFRAALEL